MQHIQYLKPCGPLLKTVAALSGFLCLGRLFIVFEELSLCRVCVCDEETKKKKCARRAGGNGAFDFLFTLGAIETPRCKRICDIESVLITKTGIKGD